MVRLDPVASSPYDVYTKRAVNLIIYNTILWKIGSCFTVDPVLQNLFSPNNYMGRQ